MIMLTAFQIVLLFVLVYSLLSVIDSKASKETKISSAVITVMSMGFIAFTMVYF